jgi:predicted 3-demethylubiquinone-9 3-methyltransferase (glyoxalase superfamily)
MSSSKFATCLWFDNQAEDAIGFYKTVFKNVSVGKTSRYTEASAKASGQKAGAAMVVDAQIENLNVLALNGGPIFKFTPAMSLFVGCDTAAEIKEMWNKLSAGGKVRMGLDKYPWAENYGWTADKFGVEWQLVQLPRPKKISPAFTFVDKLYGKGQEALDFYTSVFKDSKVEYLALDEKKKTVLHASLYLQGEPFVLSEGEGTHGWTFNEATSQVVYCDTQAEIDSYWSKLTSNGGSEAPCGWCKDKFGVSWQITPRALGKWMTDPKTADRVFAALVKMKKPDLATLERAATL